MQTIKEALSDGLTICQQIALCDATDPEMDVLLRQMATVVVPYMLVLSTHDSLRQLLTDELLLVFDQIGNSSQQNTATKVRAALCLFKEIEILGGSALGPMLRRVFIQAKLADMQL